MRKAIVLVAAGVFGLCSMGVWASSLEIGDRRGGLEETTWRKAQTRLYREALRSDALIWDSDRDMLDVVLRRTRALLTDLTANQGLSEAGAFGA
ncbi:MAG: hypothetical protein IH624_02120, partial [Phycisphaerae bacterium]|nr:hypothetical protein [Phycisphaerae bacterium]